MAKQIGTVEFVKGAVEVRTVEGIIKAVNPGDTLHEGDVLHTGANSEVRIEFFNGQNLVVGENTEFLLDETVFARLEPYADDRAEQLAQLQQALLEGDDLEAPAAGQARGAANNLHDASVYERIGDEGQVDTQLTPFEVGGGVDAFEPTDDDTIAPPVAPQTLSQQVASIFIDPITGDGVLNGQEVAADVPVSGGVGDDAGPGDTVTVRIGDETYSGTVDDNGRFSIPVPGSVLAAAGVVTAVVTVGGSDATASAEATVAVDDQIDARISVDPVTGDGVLNAAEAAGDVTITGSTGGDVVPGDTVTLRIGGEEYSGTVGPDGRFAISVPGSALAASPTVEASVTATDEAGNRMTAQASVPVTVDTAASATISVDPITDDDTVNAAEAAGEIAVTGRVGGDAAPGDTVTLVVNGHSYSGTVAADGSFSIPVPGSDLVADTTIEASVSGSDDAGNPFTTSTQSVHQVDMDGPVISVSAPDAGNDTTPILSGQTQGVPAGTVVTLIVTDANGDTQQITAITAADGSFQAEVPSPLPEGQFSVQATVTDPAGNSASAEDSGNLIDITAPQLAIELDADIAGDGIVNAAEAAGDVAISGTVSGEFAAGDTVTLTVNGNDYSGPVDANGRFSIPVPGSELLADPDRAVEAQVTHVDLAGNSATATDSAGYGVDTAASATISVDPITDDDILNAAEAAGTVPVTGQVGGDAAAGDTVTAVINGTTYTATVAPDLSYTLTVAGSDLAVDTEFEVTVSGSDDAGNPFTASAISTHSVDLDASASISVDPITDDDIINAAEAAGTIPVTGQVAGEAAPGDTVTAVINGTTYSTTVAPDLTYTLTVAGSDLVADTEFEVTVSGVDSAGNPFTASVTSTHTVNQPPLAADDAVSTDEDTPLNAIPVLANDSDPEGGPLSVVSASADHGTVTVNPDGTLNYVPDANYNGPDRISYVIEDDQGEQSSATVQITVNPVNDPATVTADSGSVTEDSAATLIVNGQVTVSDVDAGEAQIQPQNAVAGSYGSFSIDADGNWSYSADNSQAAIQSLAAGETLTESFTVTSADGSASDTVTVTIIGTNDGPVALDDSASVTEDLSPAVSGTVLTNDSDIDTSDVLTVTNPGTYSGAYGTLVLNADGSYTYTLDPATDLAGGQTVQESFGYSISDGQGGSASAQLTVTVHGTADSGNAVIGGVDTGAVIEDGILNAGGQLTVNDPDAGESAFQPASANGSYGSFSVDANGNWSYAGDNTAMQGLAEGQQVTETFTVSSLDGTTHDITVTVTGTNDAPVLSVSDLNAVEDGPAVTGQAGFSDIDASDSHVYSVSGLPAGQGSVSIDPTTGVYTYTVGNDFQQLAAGETAQVSFDVTVTDNNGDSDTRTVTVTVTGTNDAPVLAADSNTVTEDLAPVASGNVLTNDSDIDAGDALTVTNPGTYVGTYGTLVLNADGSYTYTLDPATDLPGGSSASEVFTYQASDGSDTASANLTITITGTADGGNAVITGVDSGSVTEDGIVNASGQLQVNDPDAGQSAFQPAYFSGAYGSLSIDAAGNWTYSGDNAAMQSLGAGQSLNEIFTVQSLDGTSHQVTVTVNGVNDVATVTGDSAVLTEDAAAQLTASGQVTVSDVDTGEAQVQPQNAVTGSYGSFSIDASGNWSYSADNSQAAIQSLAAGETLTESFTVTSADGSASDTVTVTITGTNDAPVLSVSDLNAVEDGPAVTGQAGFSDIDASDSHVYSVSGLPAGQGSVSIDPTTGVYTYTVGNDFQQLAAGETAQVSFDVTVTDNNGASDTRTVTVTVTGTNDAPVISGLDTGTVTEDSVLAASGQLSVSDPDHGESAFQPGNPSGSYGSLVIDASGNWSYSLDNANPAVQALGTGDSLTDTVTVTTVDGTTHDIVITIQGTNDAPVAVADSFATDEGSSLAINAANGLLANDTDAENDALQVLQVAADASGAGAVSADGVTAITTALGGTVIVHADGSFTYTAPASLDHSASDTLMDSFAYLASDGTDSSSWTTVNIAVGDTVPVAHDDSDSVGYGGTVYGNVITGAGGAGMQADDAGADGPLQLQSVTYNGVTYSGFDANGNLTINAAHGDLLINRDGSYSYSSNDLSGQPLTDDVFSYSVVDGDGDVASATLSLVHDTISTAIADSAIVDEAGLPAGTAHDSDSEFARGNLLDNDTGIGSSTQISSLSFNGVSAAPDASGVISISGDFGSLMVWTQDDGSHRAGDYEYRLTSASSGDSVVEQFVYTLSDGAHSSSNTLDIAITDDAPGGTPIVQNLQQDADPAVYNLSIILDVSGSMNSDAGNGQTRLDVAKESLQALINEVDDLGNVNVQIIPFASGTQTSGWFIDDVQGAIDYIDALQAGGSTWYDAALNAQINSSAPPPADQNLIYFLSDGEPNAGHGVDDSIQYTDANGNALTGQAAWEAYVEEHADIAFGIGIGTGVSLANLEPVAHPEVNGAEDYAIAVDDPTDLTATLLDTVSNTLIEGSLNVLGAHGNAGFVIGADGGYISEIVVDGVSYTYAPNSGDPSTMTVTTALGGQLEIDFANGDYRYTLDVDQSLLGQHELFPVTVIDNDGDVFSSTIRFNIDYQPALDANRDLVLTNIIDGTPISIGESALLHNDRGDSLSISSTGNALGGVLAANGIAFTPNAGLSVLSEDDFTTDAQAITINDRNEGGNRNDSLATATDLTDRSLFSSNDANLNGVNVNGYSLAYEGRFDSNADQDWLSVSLARGENLWLDVDNGGGVNAQASIYDANGNFVTDIDNNAGGPWGGFTAPEDGQYYVVLESADGSTGNYDLFLTINTGSADYSDGSFSYDLTNGAGVTDSTTVDIQGVSGNRITGGDADEILVSGDQGDTLVGNAGDDALLGHGGDDSLDGGAGNDLLVGGAGNDSLVGGDGIDIFALEAGDEGSLNAPAVDSIADFTAGQGGDVLDLSDLLQGETDATLDQYLSFSYDSASGNTTVNIDVQGSGSGVSQMIVLEGVDLTAGGTLSDQQILDNLLDDGNLIVDH